jgi:hypothetical protein
LPADIVDYAVNQGVLGWRNLDVFGPGAYSKASDDCRASDCCYYRSEELRLHLTASISSLFIEAILSPTASSSQGRLSAAVLSSLMQQLEKPRCAKSQLNCFYKGRPLEQLRGLLAQSLLSVSSGSYNWRQNLATNLQTAVLDSRELIIAHIKFHLSRL